MRQPATGTARGVAAGRGAIYGSENCTMSFVGPEPSANIKRLMCRARSDVGAMTGTTYIKVRLTSAGWVRGQELVVCGMVRPTGFRLVPLPTTGSSSGPRGCRSSLRSQRRRRTRSMQTARSAARKCLPPERTGCGAPDPAAPNRRRDERGAVVVLVAAMTVVLFGIAALVADLGRRGFSEVRLRLPATPPPWPPQTSSTSQGRPRLTSMPRSLPLTTTLSTTTG